MLGQFESDAGALLPADPHAALLAPGAESLPLEAVLAHFAGHGHARLGTVLSAAGRHLLGERAEALMLGRVSPDGLFFQHDAASGHYEDLHFGRGWVGPSLAYRKLEKLELDPLFLAWIENPLFARIARAVLGAEVALYRAVLWNKAARGGTELPWHQDDGRFWGLDRAPELQIWTALDDAPAGSGCVEVLPGSHRNGLATPEGGTIPAAVAAAADAETRALQLPARSGEALLIHNHLWHRSGRNGGDHPRRAIGISYLRADTRCQRRRRTPRTFRRMFVQR